MSATAHGQAAQPLVVAAEDAAAPWARADGTGFAHDVVRAAFAAAGVPIRIDVVPYARCRLMAIAGDVVACFAMSAAPDLAGRVSFPRAALFSCETQLVSGAAHTAPVAALRNLPQGTVVGVVRGYEYPSAVAEAAREGVIRLAESSSEELLLQKLAAGRVAFALVNVNAQRSLEYIRASAGVTDRFATVLRVGRLQAFIGFSERHPRGAWARGRFDEGMAQIVRGATLQTLERRWTDSSRAAVQRWTARGGEGR